MSRQRTQLCVGALLLLVIGIVVGHATAREQVASAKLRILQEERLAVLKDIQVQTTAAYGQGTTGIKAVIDARIQLLDAQIELAESREEILKLRTDLVNEAMMWEQNVARMIKNGERPGIDALKAKVFRLNAQIALEKARSETSLRNEGK
jgi:hypothetical protein